MKDQRCAPQQLDNTTGPAAQSGSSATGTDNSAALCELAEHPSGATATPALDAAAADGSGGADGGGGWWFTDLLGWNQTESAGKADLTEKGASASGELTHTAVDGTASAMSGGATVAADGKIAANGQASRGFVARMEDAPDSWEQQSSKTTAEASWGFDLFGKANTGPSGAVTHANERVSHYRGHEVTTKGTKGVSYDGDRLAASAGSSTTINDDGILRQTGGSGQVAWSDKHGAAATAQYGETVSDGEGYQTSKGVSGSIDSKQVRGAASSSAKYEDVEGRQITSTTDGWGGWDWKSGFLGGWGQSSSWAKDDSKGQTSSAITYEAGQLGAKRDTSSLVKGDDGAISTNSTSYASAAGADSMKVSGAASEGYAFDGIAGYSSVDSSVAWDAKHGMSLAANAKKGVQDGDGYHDRSQFGVSYEKGAAKASGSSDVRYTDADGVVHDETRGGAASFDAKGFGLAVNEQQTRTDGDFKAGTNTSGQLTWGENGPRMTAERGNVTGMGDDYVHARAADVQVGADGFGVGASDKTVWKDLDGNTQTQVAKGGVLVNGDGLTLQGGRANATKNVDGSTDTNSINGSVGTDGTMRGGYASERKDADGKVTGGTAVNGQLKVSEDELSAGFGVTQTFREGKSVTGGANFDYKLAEPVAVGGVWVVEYRQAISANAGGGLSKQGADTGDTGAGPAKASASASLAGQIVSGGSRTFGSEAEAKAWYERPDIGLMEGPTTDIAKVLDLQTGSSQMTLMSGELGVNASASASFLSVDVGGKAGASHGLTVTRGNDKVVYVRVDDATSLAGSLGLSTVGLGMSASTAIEAFSGTTYSFDLAEQPAQAAYVAFVERGAVPAEGTAGVVKKSVTDGTKVTDTTGIAIGGSALTFTSSQEEAVTTDDQGNVTERARGANGWTAAWEMFGWKSAEEHALDLTEVNDADRYIHGTSTVDTTSANAAHSGLARAAGVLGAANTAEGAASGRWTVETAFPPKAMDAFIDAVINGEVNPHDGMIIGNAGKRMIEGVIAANGDTDAQRSIVAAFVKEEGHQAVQAIRTNTAGNQTYLALEGSSTFVGVGGYADFEAKFREIEALTSAETYNTEHAYRQVEALSRAEHARLRDLQDFGRYADVPASLRLTERLRVEDNIARLTDLKAIIGMAIVEAGGGQAIIDPASVDSDNGNFADAFDDATDANREMERTYDSARARRITHENQGGRDNLGGSGIFGFAAGPEYQAYTKIDQLWGGAEFYRRAGTKHEDKARSFTRTDVSDASASVEFWLYAADHYLAANREFLLVIDGYRAIESRHASSVGYWT